ncbi:hypothetical protein CN984_11875 [Bacillus cereus]|uniref:Uncharacterized protein n=1 Tax=Bacillus cereus TaxID=1396 RepID=A0A2B9Q2L9_BACCE|nr:hypothetical protein [Bacillus cereus]PEA25877.1 hypothetical protein CON44_18220 [Bacillus cereus]PGO29143.1 hypothetical protein CN984_11875 [Bacillus cereus]
MTKTTKLYADGIFVSEDEMLIQDLKMVTEAKKHLSEEQHDVLYKQFCNKIRESLNIENVIGVALSDDEKEVYVPFFAIDATEKNSYTLGYNFEEGNFYMELEQHPSLEIIDLEIEEVKEEIEFAVDFEDAKEFVEQLNGLHELREATASYLESLEKLEEIAKQIQMLVAMACITCPNVLKQNK